MNNDEIVSQLKIWNEEYRAGKPSVPDPVYDALLDKLPEDHTYLNKPEPEEVNYKNRIKHKKPMLSMQKAKTDAEMEKWVNSILDACQELKISSDEIKIRGSAKLDGIAGKHEDGKYTTRGDGIYGNDVTENIRKGVIVKASLLDYKYCLGEFVVELDYFKDYLSKEVTPTGFSNPRNFVSGAIMSDEFNSLTEGAIRDNAVIFQSYNKLPHISSGLTTFLKDFREHEAIISNSVNYEIDGVIFEVVNPFVKSKMGETSHHPNWAIALKPADKVYQSVITELKFQVGRTGKITPVIHIEPTMIDNVEVRKASGHNCRMIGAMGIAVGKRVELIRSGSVIPYIVGVIDEC